MNGQHLGSPWTKKKVILCVQWLLKTPSAQIGLRSVRNMYMPLSQHDLFVSSLLALLVILLNDIYRGLFLRWVAWIGCFTGKFSRRWRTENKKGANERAFLQSKSKRTSACNYRHIFELLMHGLRNVLYKNTFFSPLTLQLKSTDSRCCSAQGTSFRYDM